MDMKIIVTESQLKTTINELYSQKLVQQLFDKFKQEQPELEDRVINFYIDRFQQIKDSPKVEQKDITQYTWEDLVNTVDPNQPQDIDIKFDNSGLIYDENNLKIYLANSKKACIKYGTGYGFCISSRGEGNVYAGYRILGEGTIYFVEDLDKSKEQNIIPSDGSDLLDGKFVDPNHLLVIMVHDDPNYPYEVTDANNEPLTTIRTWDDITRLNPKLQNLQSVFKLVDINPQEKLDHDLKKKTEIKIKNYTKYLDEQDTTFFDDVMEIKYIDPFQLKYIHNLINDIPVYNYCEKGVPREVGFKNVDPQEWQEKENQTFKHSDKGMVVKPSVERLIPSKEYMKYLVKIQGWINEYLHEKNKLNIRD